MSDKTNTAATEKPSTAKQEPAAEQPVVPTEAVSKLPKGAMTMDTAVKAMGDATGRKMAAVGGSAATMDAVSSSTFDDEHVGSGGTFAFNEKGERVRVYHEVEVDGEKQFVPIR